MLLVAPFRPQRTWLPLLHRLNRRAPWRLPARENSSRLGGWIRPAWMRECHPPGYSITGKLFSNWCTGQSEDPVRCSAPTFLGCSAVPPRQGPVSFYSESVCHVDTLESIIAQPQWVATVRCLSS